jgi:hypothetical protein
MKGTAAVLVDVHAHFMDNETVSDAYRDASHSLGKPGGEGCRELATHEAVAGVRGLAEVKLPGMHGLDLDLIDAFVFRDALPLLGLERPTA